MSKGTVNKVIILGRLGSDPDIRATAAGTTVANLSIATNHGVKDQSGNWTDATEWHKVTVFGKSADSVGQYLSKGSMVYIEGRLQTRKWQDQNGQDRYSTEVVANEVQFVGGNNNAGDGQSQQPMNQQQQDPWAQQQQQMNQQPHPQAQPQAQPQPQPQAQPQMNQRQWQQEATRGNP